MDIFTIEDAGVAGRTRFHKWLALFTREMFKEEGRMYLSLFFDSMTPDQRQGLQGVDPEAFKYLEEQVLGGDNGNA